MALSTEQKSGVVAQYRRDPKDTGSPEVQVALLSERINGLGEHFSVHHTKVLAGAKETDQGGKKQRSTDLIGLLPVDSRGPAGARHHGIGHAHAHD